MLSRAKADRLQGESLLHWMMSMWQSCSPHNQCQQSCALCCWTETKQIVLYRTQTIQGCQTRASVGAPIRVCSTGKEQLALTKHALGLKHPWEKSPQKSNPKGNWEEQKAFCWKDVRASSMQLLPNTCRVVFALLNNRTRPPFVIAWTVLTLDCAQLDSFSSLWSYRADERWADWEGQKGQSAYLDMDRTHSQEPRQRFTASLGSKSWRGQEHPHCREELHWFF